MKWRKLLFVLVVCIIAAACLSATANAAESSSKGVLWMDDLELEWVDAAVVEPCEEDATPLTNNSINGTISAHSVNTMGQLFFLQIGNVIVFNCSYSPSSASMDFGVIDSNGRFYYMNVKGGSISQTIKISQGGSFQVAIRNNSSQTVSVVGFVDY